MHALFSILQWFDRPDTNIEKKGLAPVVNEMGMLVTLTLSLTLCGPPARKPTGEA